MSNENQRPVDNRSASQKISDLENALMSLYQTADNMARDLGGAKEALKLLNNKLDSVIKASNNKEELSDSVITRIMIENNVEELSNKVKVMVAQGILAPTEQVAQDSFVVGSEINEEGNVANPRLQFAAYAIQPEAREKLIGARAGDTLTIQEGKLKFKVLEVWQIQKPKEATEQSTLEASAEAQASPAQPDQSVTPAT